MSWMLIVIVFTGNFASQSTVPFESKALCELAAKQVAEFGKGPFNNAKTICVQVKS